MATQDDEERRIGELNLLGRVVYFAGESVRVTANLLESVIKLAADTYMDAEKAFKEGLDPNVDEAQILEERRRDEKPPADG